MELRFRAKEIGTGLWVKGFYVSCLDMAVKGNPRVNAIISNRGHWHYVEPGTLGQMWEPSHGLKAYTGDLLKMQCSPSGSHKVKERIVKIGFSGKGMDVSVWHKGEWYAYSSINWTTAKHLGNIYDNASLLEQPCTCGKSSITGIELP